MSSSKSQKKAKNKGTEEEMPPLMVPYPTVHPLSAGGVGRGPAAPRGGAPAPVPNAAVTCGIAPFGGYSMSHADVDASWLQLPSCASLISSLVAHPDVGDMPRAAALCRELVRFLALSSAEPEGTLSPSPLVDVAWHAALLIPRLYHALCVHIRPEGTAAGHDTLVAHDPATALDTVADIRARFERTLAAYEAHYGAPAPEALWPRSYLAPQGLAAEGGTASAAVAATSQPRVCRVERQLIPPGSMSINVQTLTGRTYKFMVQPDELVEKVKDRISAEEGVPVVQQRLIYEGKVLKDETKLSAYDINEGATLKLVMNLRGC